MDKLGYAPVFKYLSLVGLPTAPTYLNLSDTSTNNFKFDWLSTEVSLIKILAMPLFIGISIEPNVYNTSVNCIVLGVPDMESPLPR